MALTPQQKTEIEQIIIEALRAKLRNYKPTGDAKPFHAHLLGKDRLALVSFVHSFYTNFGTTVFEAVAVKIAKQRFKTVRRNVPALSTLSSGAELVISDIMNELSNKVTAPNKANEISRIRAVCKVGDPKEATPTQHDLFLESHTGEFYFIDMKSPKPNKGEFKGFKRTLLEWYAVYLYEHPKAIVHGIIAPPYNPYDPKPYNPSTAKGIMDLGKDLRAAEDFWDFLGGEGTYTDLLGCFERAGITMRKEIDDYFDRFKT